MDNICNTNTYMLITTSCEVCTKNTHKMANHKTYKCIDDET